VIVTCEKCDIQYEDTYHLTVCPHEEFQMNCVVAKDGKVLGTAHSVEELRAMLAKEDQ
jgi:hypothetical protein